MDGAAAQIDARLETAVPRPLAARAVVFRVKPGPRWHVAAVEITGLTVLPLKTARAFFRMESMLFVLAKTNAYSPAHVESAPARCSANCNARLRRGRRAREAAKIDEKTGAVPCISR